MKGKVYKVSKYKSNEMHKPNGTYLLKGTSVIGV